MTDIVDRLRSQYAQNGTNYAQEAAMDIERLRAEVERLKEMALMLGTQSLGKDDTIAQLCCELKVQGRKAG